MKQVNVQDVQDSVDAFVEEGDSFSAFDITQSLRNDGFWADHAFVRDVVHNYCASLALQKSNNGQYWVYEPKQAPQPTLNSYYNTPVVSSNRTSNAGGKVVGSARVGLNGKVTIPKGVVERLATPGQRIYTTEESNGARVYFSDPGKWKHTNIVDRSCNIRFPYGDVNDVYQVMVDGNTLFVRK